MALQERQRRDRQNRATALRTRYPVLHSRQPIGDGKHWSRIQISGHELYRLSLRPRLWLNDQVVDFYLQIKARELLKPKQHQAGRLRWGEAGALVWPSQFWNKLSGEGTQGGGVYKYSAVRGWTTRKGLDLFGLDLLLVPLCDGAHWSLGVVDFRKRELLHLCSFARDKKATKPSWFRCIKNYLADEWKDKKSDAAPPFCFKTGWAQEVDANDYNCIDEDQHTVGKSSESYAKRHGVPKQNNDNDCGVFAIVFAVQVLQQYVKSRDKRPFALKATPAEIDDWRNVIAIEMVAEAEAPTPASSVDEGQGEDHAPALLCDAGTPALSSDGFLDPGRQLSGLRLWPPEWAEPGQLPDKVPQSEPSDSSDEPEQAPDPGFIDEDEESQQQSSHDDHD
eukprot:g2307.t1